MRLLRRRSPASLVAVLGVALLLPAGLALAQEADVVLITDTLEPAHLEVAPGTTVTWRNEDDERHRVRSREGPEEFDSGNLEPGESFMFTFSAAGTYPYLDHRNEDDPAYAGTIVVGAAGGSSGGPAEDLPDSGSVSIVDRSFAPGALEIATGGTVTWSNDDGGDRHTVTADDGSFDSGILEGGATFSQTFAEPGGFPYLCAIHPEMRGTITVADALVPGPSAVPTAELVSASDAASDSPSEPASPSASASASASPSASTSASASASPSTSASSSPFASGSASAGAPVTMLGREFHPGSVQVAVGETVDWLNDDGEAHTVTALDGSFNSGIIGIDDAFAVTFDEPGEVDYLCAIHPDMKGTVTVTE